MPDLSPENGPGGPGRAGLISRLQACRARSIAALLLAASVAIVFLVPRNLLFGAADTDIIRQFLAWRSFAAENLRAGHLPLWNPYTFSGQPFLGGVQSALLYPLNLIFVVLPLCRAANLSLLIHLIILGWGMHRFACRRGLHPLAAALCGFLLPLSGAAFPHVYAGHLSNLCSMAWAPWVFAGLEDWFAGRRHRGLLLAGAAVCLQILAGHMQYVFYTGVAAGLYALVRTVLEPAAWSRALPGVAAAYLAGAALSAAQLFPGIAAVGESLRHAKLSFPFASMFSLPPENLITFMAPGFFGDLAGHVYWGRDYLWEMSVFVGASGLVLAATALLDRAQRRAAWLEMGMTALLLLFAMSGHTPLFRMLYDHVPGFDRFRGVSKFTFPALIFLVLAIGRGADALLNNRLPGPALPACAVQAGAAIGCAGIALWFRPELLAGFLALIRKSGESYLPVQVFADSGFIRNAGLQAGRSLILTGVVLLLAGGSLHFARRRPLFRWVPLALLALEMIGFAPMHFATSNAAEVLPRGLKAFVAAHPGDYRVSDPQVPDNGYLLGAPDIWGNDPGPLTRYAEFITFTQGGDLNQISQNFVLRTYPRLFAMLRFRYAFLVTGSGSSDIAGSNIEVDGLATPPMSRVQLLSSYRVIPGRDGIFSAMVLPAFDPRQTVLLESEPDPRPAPGADPGAVRVLAASTDSLTIEAEVKSPALLLITDLYSDDWRARALPGSAQQKYAILPADYILRAIPLAAGHHLIRVEYVPGGFRLGIAVSAAAVLLWLGAAFRLRKEPR